MRERIKPAPLADAPRSPTCMQARLDGDDDVHLNDFAFSRAVSAGQESRQTRRVRNEGQPMKSTKQQVQPVGISRRNSTSSVVPRLCLPLFAVAWAWCSSYTPAAVAENLILNPGFEQPFSGGVAAGWQSWSASGTGYWKQSSRLGRIGAGVYGGGGTVVPIITRLAPKTILVSDIGLGATGGLRAAMPDALIVGRLFIDHVMNQYLTDPEFYGRKHADDCYTAHLDKPGIDAWHGFCEPYMNEVEAARRVARFERAFALRCRERGLKSCVFNLAVGNPGDMNIMLLDEVIACLAVADYAGYHSYGGTRDQFMVGPQAPWFSLRWRSYMNMYRERGLRMPPVIYTECTTFTAWKGTFTAAQVRDDLIAFEALSKPDPWSVGMCIFQFGAGDPTWDARQCMNEPVIYQGCGDYNLNHPADAWQGLYSQQFGENSGGFTGGIRQVVTLAPGKSYKLRHTMKYETYGVNGVPSFCVGYDLSGQTGDPNAATLTWSADLISLENRETDWWYEHSLAFTATGTTASIWFKGSQLPSKSRWRIMVDEVSLDEYIIPNGPVIHRAPAALTPAVTQGANAPSQSFTLANVGTDSLNYTITDNADWLSVAPTSGVSSGEAKTHTVSFATSTLTPGSHSATILISDPAAANHPQSISVSLTVSPVIPFPGLSNPGFENGFFDDPNIDNRSGNAWKQFKLSGSSKSGGHATVKRNGTWSQAFWESNYHSGLYQRVADARIGSLYTGRAWVYGNGIAFRVGVDPAGGTNPSAPSVQWSNPFAGTNAWSQITCQVTATSTAVTLFITCQNTSPTNRYAYFDDCSLIEQFVPVFAKGDFDRDGDVDQSDFGHFQACYSGTDVAQLDPACADAKLDADDDVDLDDFGIFQSCLSGTNVPANPECSP